MGFCGQPQRQQLSASQEEQLKYIVELVNLCLRTGHMTPCNRLFLLLLKIHGSPAQKFQTLYIPLIPRLRDVMRKKGLNLRSSPFSDFLQLLVGSYLRDVLGAQGRNQRAKFRKIGCGCGDCALVDSFLASTKSAQETFRLAQPRRIHLEKCLSAAPDLLTFVTVRSGSPHGVTVTKKPEIVASLQWAARVAQAKAFLRTIGDDDAISQLMGDRYADVLNALNGAQPFALTVGDAANSTLTAPSQGPSALPANVHSNLSSKDPALLTSTSYAGAKRKKDPIVNLGVIDLTGDDSS